MTMTALRQPRIPLALAPAMPSQVVGELIELRQGRAVVRHAGGPTTGLLARVLAHVFAPGLPPPTLPCAVLLFLEAGDALKPIIVGLVQEALPSSRALVLDLDRIVLQGHTEVQLRCGSASVTMNADGKVVVKGTEVLSKASATNKIRGASVQIN
jgi:Domain of unknown function (DUF6484)